jgi:hypothetical protein
MDLKKRFAALDANELTQDDTHTHRALAMTKQDTLTNLFQDWEEGELCHDELLNHLNDMNIHGGIDGDKYIGYDYTDQAWVCYPSTTEV